MQFIYILSLNKQYHDDSSWTAEANANMSLHFNYLKNLFETGGMIHVGRTDLPSNHEHLHGYAIFEASDESSARNIMDNDPAVLHGIMSAQLFPYIIVFNQKGA